MGVRVLWDRDEGAACFYDSVTMTAFGPLFDDETACDLYAHEAAAAFLAQCTERDPRQMTDKRLRDEVDAWARGTFSTVEGVAVTEES